MFTAKQFRAKAAESAESLKHTAVPSEIREFQRSIDSFKALAENEDWLANNFLQDHALLRYVVVPDSQFRY